MRPILSLGLFAGMSLLLFMYDAHADLNETGIEESPVRLLKQYLNDQSEFERKARAFDKLHIAIARSHYLEARVLEDQGDAEGAVNASAMAQKNLQWVKEAYDLGLAHFDNSPMLHNFYGELIHDYFGRANEASKHWNRAVQLDSKCARAHNNLGMYYCHAGMYAMGVNSLDESLKLEPNNPDFLFNMTQVYLTHFPQIMQIRKWPRDKVYQEAMKISERAIRYAPDDFQLLRDYALNYFLGESFDVKVDWRKAARAWQAARPHAHTDAERFNTWLNEARVHLRNDDRNRANACLDSARAIWPDSPVVKRLLEDFKE